MEINKKHGNCGKKRSKETLLKMSISHLGQKSTMGHLGHKHSEEARKKISLARVGRKLSEKTKAKMRLSAKKGSDRHDWKGGYENKLHQNKIRLYMHKNADGSHSLQQWQELKKNFNYMCLCCKQQEPFIKLTEDHIVPLSLGGSNDISNIQPLCRSCNSRKHTQIVNYKEALAIRFR